MRDLFKTIGFVSVMTIAGTSAALGQDAAADPGAAAAAAESAVAEPVTEENATVGQSYVKATNGDWTVGCIRAEIGQKDRCEMQQILKDGEGNAVVNASVTIRSNETETFAVMKFLTPLETFLPPGVEIAIDGNRAGRVPFLICTPRFCRSEVTLKDGDVQSFKRGGEAGITIVPAGAPDQKVTLVMSLKGFTASYELLAGL